MDDESIHFFYKIFEFFWKRMEMMMKMKMGVVDVEDLGWQENHWKFPGLPLEADEVLQSLLNPKSERSWGWKSRGTCRRSRWQER